MTPKQVKELQDKLVREGYMSQAEVDTGYGIFGPRTTAALAAAERGDAPKYKPTAGNVGGGTSGGQVDDAKTKHDKEVADLAKNNPKVNESINAGNTWESIQNAISSGNFSDILDANGQPFSADIQQEAANQAEKDVAAFYEAQKTKEKLDTETSLAQKQADYQNYLLTSGQNFQEDKTTADQSAANTGVLFSGGRVQKEKQLQDKYTQDQTYKQGNLGRDISGIASDYQSKYGTDAANSLSNYYKLGGNTYNPNVATGGVSSSGLSNVYKPNDYNLGTGSRIKEKAIDINKRIGGYLWNKANKSVSTGYQNKYQ